MQGPEGRADIPGKYYRRIGADIAPVVKITIFG
jgi:hypothetical protein